VSKLKSLMEHFSTFNVFQAVFVMRSGIVHLLEFRLVEVLRPTETETVAWSDNSELDSGNNKSLDADQPNNRRMRQWVTSHYAYWQYGA
jgi:hypothetical protein